MYTCIDRDKFGSYKFNQSKLLASNKEGASSEIKLYIT